MRTRRLTYGLLIVVAATMTGCAADGSRMNMASEEGVKPVSAREAGEGSGHGDGGRQSRGHGPGISSPGAT
jgi:hypothetical protein